MCGMLYSLETKIYMCHSSVNTGSVLREPRATVLHGGWMQINIRTLGAILIILTMSDMQAGL